jgi:O-antigen/teichoic acid export membrane protein
VLYTRGRVANALFNSVLANSVRLGVLVMFGAQGRLSGVTALLAIGWGSFAALVPGLWSTRGYWTREMLNLGYTFKNNWTFGRWVLGGSVASWISVEFYPVLTAGLVSFAAAGAYRALQNLVAPIHLLLRAIDTFFTPRAARLYAQAGRPGVARLLRLIYLATLIPMLGILAIAVLFREQLLYLLYGDTYLAYSQGIVLMVIFYGLLYAYGPLQSAFKAMRVSRPIFTANIVATIAMFTFGILAILRWGVYGTLGGQVLNALLVNLILWTSWMRAKKDG